jgi:hypothetical protein
VITLADNNTRTQMDVKPRFLITIDTEGDNLWAKPQRITTGNSAFLPRFQELCERHGFKPTYLTNYEMAKCRVFRAFARDVLTRGAGEIGMHLHAWNSPPEVPLTRDDYRYHPYLIEYDLDLMRAKITTMTALLEDAFGVKMVSHRAGRWSFDERYAALLVEQGYGVDCSVTPHVSWRSSRGDPAGIGGSDFTHFPSDPYFVDLQDISQPGDSSLLEVPMTIVPGRRAARLLTRVPLPGSRMRQAVQRFFPPVHWLRPNGRNRSSLIRLVEQLVEENREHAEFMLHSSEFMPGGSPKFRDQPSIDALYSDLELLFATISESFQGETLSGFREHWLQRTNAGTR